MFLFEIEDPFIAKLVSVTAQLRSQLEAGGKKAKPWTRGKLLDFYASNDLDLEDQLNDMISKPPLNTLISNIEGNDNDAEVIFKMGDASDETQKTTDNKKKTLAKMANRAQDLPVTGTLPQPDIAEPAAPPPPM